MCYTHYLPLFKTEASIKALGRLDHSDIKTAMDIHTHYTKNNVHLYKLVGSVEHHTNDAILSLNPANELFFKLFLKRSREYLIFIDINPYMNENK